MTKNAAPIAATPAAFPICAVVPYAPKRERDKACDLERAAFDQHLGAAMPRPHAAVARGNDEGEGERNEGQAGCERRDLQASLHE